MRLKNILLKKQSIERETIGLKKEAHITQDLKTTVNSAKGSKNFKIIFTVIGKSQEEEEERNLFNAEFEYRADYELDVGEVIDKDGNLREVITNLYRERVIPKLQDFFNESGMSTIDAIEF